MPTPATMTMTTRRTLSSASDTIRIAVPMDVRFYFTTAVIVGHGGYQSFSRLLASRLKDTPVLRLSPTEFDRMLRYASTYGEGGFQTRLRKIIVNWAAQHLGNEKE